MTIVFTATDECGNTDTCSRTVYLIDTTDPIIISCAADTIVDCTSLTDTATTGRIIAIDDCNIEITDITWNDTIINGSCADNYTIERTWTATDSCGNSSTCLQTIMVQDTADPDIVCPSDTTVDCTEDASPGNLGMATATDNCTDVVTDITWNDTIIDGSCADNYTIERTWTATDSCGNSSTCLQTIMVQDTTDPTITCPPDTVINCTEDTDPENTGFATAVDNCSNDVMDITFSDNITLGECVDNYRIDRTWTATDSCGNSTTCRQVIRVRDTVSPVITFCPPDTVIDCTENTSPDNLGIVEAIDNCTDSVTYKMWVDTIIEGGCNNEFTIERLWMVRDSCGNESTCLQTIMVQDTTDPVITCPSDTTVDCTSLTDTATLGVATATDNCTDSVTNITYSDTIVEGSCADNYTIERTWTATDSCGNSSTCLQTIMVQDTTDPDITCPADTTVNCTEDTSPGNLGMATATDNCTDDVTDITFSDNIVSGSCADNYTIERTWTATDSCGNSSTCLQTIMVQDTTDPVIDCTMASDTTVSCDQDVNPGNLGMASATDNCTDSVTNITFSDSIIPGNCVNEYTIERTWTATDSCGNASTCLQTIMVIDTVGPTITCPDTADIFCGESELPDSTGYPAGMDNCSDAVVSYTDSTFTGVCEGEKIIYRTWTSEDSCGNPGNSCQQVINVRCVSCVEIEKEVVAGPTSTGNPNEYEVEYRINIWNPSIFGITFDVTDTLLYGDGINVTSATAAYVNGDGQQGIPGGFVGNVALISDDEMLGPDAFDTFSVTVIYELQLDSLTADEADCSLQTGGSDGTGLLNVGGVVEPTITVTDSVCVETPFPILSNFKEVSQDVMLTGTPFTYTIQYRLVVSNTGTAKGWYDLSDTLKFGNGITVDTATASYEGGDGLSGVGPALPIGFSGDWVQIVDEEMVLPSRSDSFLVDVTFSVDPTAIDSASADCILTIDESGSGVVNVSEVSDKYPTRLDTACVEFTASLGDFVWDDMDGNGIQDPGENGFENIDVSLYTCTGQFIGTETTDSNGFYLFDPLAPGQYYALFDMGQLDTLYSWTRQDQGGDDNLDSDVNAAGLGPCTLLDVGEDDRSYDAGLVILSTIGNFVWEDLDGDGIQDTLEPGIEGIEVFLHDANTGDLVQQDITDQDGFYLFADIFPGDYYIRFVFGSEWSLTQQNVGGDDNVDSDISNDFGPNTTSLISLPSNMIDVSWDLGLFRCAPLGDFVWFDIDADGIQDASENGINGVRVYLYDINGNLIDQTITGPDPNTASGDGYYKFCVGPGEYFIVFERPGHLAASDPYVGNNREVDSDITHHFVMYSTDTIEVTGSGSMNCDIDGGFHHKATMGDMVWYDANSNGVQDAGEPRIQGATISAYDENGIMFWQDQSDINGQFYMDGLSTGDYFLKFDPPSGYMFTTPNATLEEFDSDVDGSNGPRTTTFFHVNPGEHEPDVDAGLVSGFLPIELLDFNAVLNGDRVDVTWRTAVELNTDFFEVERRHESEKDFTVIGEVEAAGTSYSPQDYLLKDFDVQETGLYYYRLRQVDRDGAFGYSEIRVVEVKGTINTINLYPNPTSDLLTLELYLNKGSQFSIDLQDEMGRTVPDHYIEIDAKAGYNKHQIDVRNIPSGVYIIRLKVDDDVELMRFTKVN
ncbi:MAG: SdrD B-like domain-containing protein [Saprospiraceae bacterium]|nr:SdrD B-like domain-containing protein [Saprospiraceae bacterium]